MTPDRDGPAIIIPRHRRRLDDDDNGDGRAGRLLVLVFGLVSGLLMGGAIGYLIALWTAQPPPQLTICSATLIIAYVVAFGLDVVVGVIGVVRGPDGKVQAAHIEVGRFLGIGNRVVTVDANAFEELTDRVKLRITGDAVCSLPEARRQQGGVPRSAPLPTLLQL